MVHQYERLDGIPNDRKSDLVDAGTQILYQLGRSAQSSGVHCIDTFTQNERVLCYHIHGPMIYEAKILKINNWDKATTRTGSIGSHLFVCYNGNEFTLSMCLSI